MRTAPSKLLIHHQAYVFQIFFTLPVGFAFSNTIAQNTNTVLFDNGWKFFRGGAQSAEQVNFDDSKWRDIDLPHDYSIEDLPGAASPFSPLAISQVGGGLQQLVRPGTGRRLTCLYNKRANASLCSSTVCT